MEIESVSAFERRMMPLEMAECSLPDDFLALGSPVI